MSEEVEGGMSFEKGERDFEREGVLKEPPPVREWMRDEWADSHEFYEICEEVSAKYSDCRCDNNDKATSR